MAMNDVLRGLNCYHAIVYIDDIIVFSQNLNQHMDYLSQVFDRLRQANLKLKPGKCQFTASQVNYSGHNISKNGVEVDPSKTAAVRDFPVPKTQHNVRLFLGLCNYYRKFVEGFARIATPLSNLLRKDVTFK